MSLPDSWVERIFSKLAVTYGAAFLRKYDGVPLEDVKADWAHVLSGFQQMPDAIRRGLEHLPSDKPPTVLEFRDACRKTPVSTFQALSAPKPDPAVAARVRAAFNRPMQEAKPLDWAWKLRGREVAGEKLTAAQRAMWRTAIGGDLVDGQVAA